MTCRTGLGLVVVALGLSIAATGFAAEQAATDSGGAPAPKTIAPPGAGPDKPNDDVALPPRVPWRGTTLSWSNSATTTLLGLGRDNIGGSHEVYAMSWSLALNYFVVDQDKYSISVTMVPNVAVELTNSGTTTTEREPQFGDLPLLANYNRALFSSGLFSTSLGLTSGFIFPTSPTSSAIGTHLVTTQRLSLGQSIPLFGKKAPAFKSFRLGLNARWDHRFGKASTAVNDDLNRLRQDASGNTLPEDQLSFGGISSNTLREGVSLTFAETPGGMPISLTGSFSFAQSFIPTFNGGDCVVQIATGCVPEPDPVTAQDAASVRTTYGFSVSTTWQPLPEAAISLSYANATNTLGPDGLRRSAFYSPGASFSGTISFFPDALFERMTGPKRAIAEKRDRRRQSF